MIRQILLLIGVIFLVTGCNIELKKSANNKLFDTKGFDGGKRRPVYNNKYIDRAKRNIADGDYDEEVIDIEEPDEYVDPYTKNRIMYSNMIKNDQSKKRGKSRGNQNPYDQPYPNIGHAKDIALSKTGTAQSNEDLRKELAEIKTMLAGAKTDLAKYKCPLQESPAVTRSNQAAVQKKSTTSDKKPKKPIAPLEDSDELNYDNPMNDSSNEEEKNSTEQQVPNSANTPASNIVPASSQPASSPISQQAPAAVPAAPAASTVPSNNTNGHMDIHDDEIIDEVPAAHTNNRAVHLDPPAHNMINLSPVK